MNFLPTWLGWRKPKNSFTVDFDQDVTLPRGADKVLWHHPASKGKVTLQPEHLVVRPMPRGVTYLEYKATNPEAVFGDALILDALLAPYRDANARSSEKVLEKLLQDFSGQIFFLGTAFEAIHGGRPTECFAYLSWRMYQPALRYMCPAHHPINHSVNCCALHIEMLPARATRE